MLSFGRLFLGALLVIFSPHLLANENIAEGKITALQKLTLESIMADPDWMGNGPESAHWSLDGLSIYFQQKADGHTYRNNLKVNLSDHKTVVLEEKDKVFAQANGLSKMNPSRTLGVFGYQDNLYLFDLKQQSTKQITSDLQKQSHPIFVNDKTISYRVGYGLFLYHTDSGLFQQIADFKLEDEPDFEPENNYLKQSQSRLFDYLKKQEQEKTTQESRKDNAATQKAKVWYLGEGERIKTFSLSPDAQWLILGTVSNQRSGKSDHMPEFVTSDGYVNDKEVRSLVGTSEPLNESFFLIDLERQTKQSLTLSHLPGISDDPLKKLRHRAAQKIGYKYQDMNGDRAVYAHSSSLNDGVVWTKDSSKAAIMLFSFDNKARWIVALDKSTAELKTAHWMTDDAWVNDRSFNEFGWLPDSNTLYYLSEESGYAHLYIKKGKRKSSQLTSGKFEVSDLTVAKNGLQIYFRANQKHPGIYEIYAYDLDKRDSVALTNMGGVNYFKLSPDEQSLLITHSTTTQKPELYLKKLSDVNVPVRLTNTISQNYKKYLWQAPKIIQVKSSDVNRPIYSRLYSPEADASKKISTTKKRPAVIFVHGSGYSQNSHQGWSYYFREHMFHNYLSDKGYVVLDMDYRASKGYGRDWRTAIYRNMGTPELQDLKDGAKWLVDNMNVDAERIGVYGGSYGGFMAFMALFKEPELFASGAALRPVTDWSHYEHGYTSNILNTPQVDPDAYERSSPIEFAAGLTKPLLICHGMVDDNVFFKDSVRLVQKLIELKKTKYFEMAIYPVEPHGFRQPSSWLDEYTRIEQLFERTLK